MKLRYTLRGAAELDQVLGYIEMRSPQGARHVQHASNSSSIYYCKHPRAGRLTSKAGLRRMVASPYPFLIFYRATEDEIVIHGVRHTARRPSAPE